MASIDRDKLGEYLSAYLDGELPEREREALERLVAKDQLARKQLDELRHTTELVRRLPRGSAPASLVADVTALLERRELLGDTEEVTPPRRRPRWMSAGSWLSAAAVIMITVGGGWYVFDTMRRPAAPPLEDALAWRGVDQPIAPESPQAGAAAQRESGGQEQAATTHTGYGAQAEPKDAPGEAYALREIATGLESAERLGAKTETADVRARGKGERGPSERGAVAAAPPTEPPKVGASPSEKLGLPSRLAAAPRTREILADEGNRLVVQTWDAADERLAQSQIAEFAVANSLEPVTVAGLDEGVTQGVPLIFEEQPAPGPQPAEGVRIVMNLPRGELGQLVEAVSRNPRRRRAVTLQIADAVAQQPAEVEALVRRAQTAPRVPRAGEATEQEVAAGDKADTTDAAAARPSVRPSRGPTSVLPETGVRGPAGDQTQRGAEAKRTDQDAGATDGPAAKRATSGPADQAGTQAGGRPAQTFEQFINELAKAAGLEVAGEAGKAASPPADARPEESRTTSARDEFITVVVEFQRAAADSIAASQPAPGSGHE